MAFGALILLAASSCHAQGVGKERQMSNGGTETAAPIGTASQEADGTIVLMLRAEGAGGALGDAQMRYAPTDKDYAMVARHVGPIPKGGSVPVKPFP
jgi:hypothetical protein